MENYNLFLTKRTYVAPNERSVDDFSMGLNDLVDGIETIRTHGFPIEVRLDVTMDLDGFGKSELNEEVGEILEWIHRLGIPYHFTPDKTAREKFVDGLFGRDVSKADAPPLTAVCCVDQYPIGSLENLEAVEDIASRMVKERGIFANGSRNVPVVLAQTEEANRMRIIHEMYNSLAMGGSDRLASVPNSEVEAQTSDCYRVIGESTSGFYFANPENGCFPRLQADVRELNTPAAPWFAIEYYAALRSSDLGRISTGYVFANSNPFDVDASAGHDTAVDKDREWLGFSMKIQETCRFLGETNVGTLLDATLVNDDNVDILSTYFPRGEVEETRDLMLNSLRG